MERGLFFITTDKPRNRGEDVKKCRSGERQRDSSRIPKARTYYVEREKGVPVPREREVGGL